MQKIALFLLLVFLPSCYGYHVVEHFTPLESARQCDYQPEGVFLFFDGEPTDFRYERIGTISVLGTPTTTGAENLNRLKTLASDHCADAVIGVQMGHANRAVGSYLDDGEGNFPANEVRGLAVRIKRDSVFNAKYGHMAHYDFRSPVVAAKEQERKDTRDAVIVGVLGTLLGLFFIVMSVEQGGE